MAGVVVARQRQAQGLPACSRTSRLAVLFLHLGTGLVLLTWVLSLDDGEAAFDLYAIIVVTLGIPLIVLPVFTAVYATGVSLRYGTTAGAFSM